MEEGSGAIMEGLKAMMPLNFLECALCVPQFCCGALFGLGFCAYYFFEVVKVSPGAEAWRAGGKPLLPEIIDSF